MEQLKNKKSEIKEFKVALITVKARAGYLNSYDNIDLINSLDKYAIPPGVSYTGAIWRYFEVDGDSMEPALQRGYSWLFTVLNCIKRVNYFHFAVKVFAKTISKRFFVIH